MKAGVDGANGVRTFVPLERNRDKLSCVRRSRANEPFTQLIKELTLYVGNHEGHNGLRSCGQQTILKIQFLSPSVPPTD